MLMACPPAHATRLLPVKCARPRVDGGACTKAPAPGGSWLIANPPLLAGGGGGNIFAVCPIGGGGPRPAMTKCKHFPPTTSLTVLPLLGFDPDKG